jgi:dTDP-glucose 4,6-dehydratase
LRSVNNYGIYQKTEKLIPKIITHALRGQRIPIYGDGSAIREWLSVKDLVKALRCLISAPIHIGTFNIGSGVRLNNLELTESLCAKLDARYAHRRNELGLDSYFDLVDFVEDRAGHDYQYWVDSRKIQKETDWKPGIEFDKGIESVIDWYAGRALKLDEVI